MDIPFETQKAKIDFSIRKMTDTDYRILFEDSITHLSNYEYINYLRRILLFDSGFNQCYVSVNSNDVPMLMIWVIGSDEYDKINKIFQNGVPKITSDEVMIEGVYTHPDFRGKKIMTETLIKLSELIKQEGKKFVVGYVEYDNLPSLKALQNTGFYIDKIKIDKWMFFRKNSVYLNVEDSIKQIEVINNFYTSHQPAKC